VQKGLRRAELLSYSGEFEAAREVLQEVVDAAMLLVVDIHTLEIQARINAHFAQAVPSPEEAPKPQKTKKKRAPMTDKERAVVDEMTKQGFTMREIAHVIKRSPSMVWYWQHNTKRAKS